VSSRRPRTWDPLVLFMDWLLADPRRARRGLWILYPLLGAVIIATPWIEERFHPPFGKYWRWNGTTGGPSGAGEKLIYGVGYLLLLVTMILLVGHRRLFGRRDGTGSTESTARKRR